MRWAKAADISQRTYDSAFKWRRTELPRRSNRRRPRIPARNEAGPRRRRTQSGNPAPRPLGSHRFERRRQTRGRALRRRRNREIAKIAESAKKSKLKKLTSDQR